LIRYRLYESLFKKAEKSLFLFRLFIYFTHLVTYTALIQESLKKPLIIYSILSRFALAMQIAGLLELLAYLTLYSYDVQDL
jgi:hypothetical protein